MAHLLRCPIDHKKFRNIGNLSSHMRKAHPNSVSASIRNGLRSSHKTPANRAAALEKCVRAVSSVVIGITPAIAARDPVLALGAIESIGRAINECAEFIPGLR